jgi:hypothetical protein
LTSVTFAAQLALPAEVTASGLLPLCLFESRSMVGSSSAQLHEAVTVRRGGCLYIFQRLGGDPLRGGIENALYCCLRLRWQRHRGSLCAGQPHGLGSSVGSISASTDAAV